MDPFSGVAALDDDGSSFFLTALLGSAAAVPTRRASIAPDAKRLKAVAAAQAAADAAAAASAAADAAGAVTTFELEALSGPASETSSEAGGPTNLLDKLSVVDGFDVEVISANKEEQAASLEANTRRNEDLDGEIEALDKAVLHMKRLKASLARDGFSGASAAIERRLKSHVAQKEKLVAVLRSRRDTLRRDCRDLRLDINQARAQQVALRELVERAKLEVKARMEALNAVHERGATAAAELANMRRAKDAFIASANVEADALRAEVRAVEAELLAVQTEAAARNNMSSLAVAAAKEAKEAAAAAAAGGGSASGPGSGNLTEDQEAATRVRIIKVDGFIRDLEAVIGDLYSQTEQLTETFRLMMAAGGHTSLESLTEAFAGEEAERYEVYGYCQATTAEAMKYEEEATRIKGEIKALGRELRAQEAAGRAQVAALKGDISKLGAAVNDVNRARARAMARTRALLTSLLSLYYAVGGSSPALLQLALSSRPSTAAAAAKSTARSAWRAKKSAEAWAAAAALAEAREKRAAAAAGVSAAGIGTLVAAAGGSGGSGAAAGSSGGASPPPMRRQGSVRLNAAGGAGGAAAAPSGGDASTSVVAADRQRQEDMRSLLSLASSIKSDEEDEGFLLGAGALEELEGGAGSAFPAPSPFAPGVTASPGFGPLGGRGEAALFSDASVDIPVSLPVVEAVSGETEALLARLLDGLNVLLADYKAAPAGSPLAAAARATPSSLFPRLATWFATAVEVGCGAGAAAGRPGLWGTEAPPATAASVAAPGGAASSAAAAFRTYHLSVAGGEEAGAAVAASSVAAGPSTPGGVRGSRAGSLHSRGTAGTGGLRGGGGARSGSVSPGPDNGLQRLGTAGSSFSLRSAGSSLGRLSDEEDDDDAGGGKGGGGKDGDEGDGKAGEGKDDDGSASLPRGSPMPVWTTGEEGAGGGDGPSSPPSSPPRRSRAPGSTASLSSNATGHRTLGSSGVSVPIFVSSGEGPVAAAAPSTPGDAARATLATPGGSVGRSAFTPRPGTNGSVGSTRSMSSRWTDSRAAGSGLRGAAAVAAATAAVAAAVEAEEAAAVARGIPGFVPLDFPAFLARLYAPATPFSLPAPGGSGRGGAPSPGGGAASGAGAPSPRPGFLARLVPAEGAASALPPPAVSTLPALAPSPAPAATTLAALDWLAPALSCLTGADLELLLDDFYGGRLPKVAKAPRGRTLAVPLLNGGGAGGAGAAPAPAPPAPLPGALTTTLIAATAVTKMKTGSFAPTLNPTAAAAALAENAAAAATAVAPGTAGGASSVGTLGSSPRRPPAGSMSSMGSPMLSSPGTAGTIGSSVSTGRAAAGGARSSGASPLPAGVRGGAGGAARSRANSGAAGSAGGGKVGAAAARGGVKQPSFRPFIYTLAPELMEFEHVGKICSHKGCAVHDFLPFDCDACAQVFCLDHRSYIAHACPLAAAALKDALVVICPLCAGSVHYTADQDVHVAFDAHVNGGGCEPGKRGERLKKRRARCPVHGCREVLGPSSSHTCDVCRTTFCLGHRYGDSHQCAARKRLLLSGGAGGAGGVGSRGGAAPSSSNVGGSLLSRMSKLLSGGSSSSSSSSASAGASRSSAPAPAASSTASRAPGVAAPPAASRPPPPPQHPEPAEICPTCGARFSCVEALIAHADWAHPPERPSAAVDTSGRRKPAPGGAPGAVAGPREVCPNCGLSFPDVLALVSHVEGKGCPGLPDSRAVPAAAR